MPFVVRNVRGAVIAIYREQTEEAQEYLRPQDAEILDFLPANEEAFEDPLIQSKAELTETDFALIRAIEDLIKVLLDKGIVTREDMPARALELIERRQQLRQLLAEIHKAGLPTAP